MEIKFTNQITADDYIDAQFLHLTWRSYAMIGTYFLFLLLVLAYFFDVGTDNLSWVYCLAAWMVGVSIFWAILVWSIKRRSRRTYAQQKSLRVPHDNRITDDTFYSHSENGDVHMKWEDFHKWKGNEKLILVYPSDRIFIMFPRRSFASPDDFAAFKNLLAEIIGPSGKGRKLKL